MAKRRLQTAQEEASTQLQTQGSSAPTDEQNVPDGKPNDIKKTCGRCCKIKSSMWGTGQEYLCNSCRTESGQGRGNSLKKYQNKESSLASNPSIDDGDKDVDDCLHQLIMENDVKKVEQSVKEHSEELSTTLGQMEHWLEELLNTITSSCRALVEVGLENDYEPQDYLNFFCLGNREAADSEYNPDGATSLPKNSPQVLSCTNRRFMIYVHLKGMIVDDEYVMLGSANINQRSLDGSRDTEIAMGAYQPRYTWASKSSAPHGQLYGYGVSLLADHIGVLEECFKRPESLQCVRRVRSMAEQNWMQWAADEITELKGHLLKYPVEVDKVGKVKPLPDCKTFPDVGGKIIGSLGTGPISIKENLTIIIIWFLSWLVV